MMRLSRRLTRRVLANLPPSDLPRVNIGIFGKMNAGKSLCMNQVTQHQTSIVDSTPGTTADVKIAFMELHEVGPVKLFDTPGTDEMGVLGDKKKSQTFFRLKQCDVVVLVLRPFEELHDCDIDVARFAAEDNDRHLLVLYNVFEDDDITLLDERIDELEETLAVDSQSFESLVMNLSLDNVTHKLHTFLESPYVDLDAAGVAIKKPKVHPLPSDLDCPIVMMNIPMDELTPSGRLLRPQAVVQEHCLRNWMSTFAYRMNLGDARSGVDELVLAEKDRFQTYVETLTGLGCGLLITDSQAMDIVGPWTLSDDPDGDPLIPITTFSIAMANLMSDGELGTFLAGIERFDQLQEGEKVLIVEACSHNRIVDDIGTVQIPTRIEEVFGDSVSYDFAFGKGYQAVDLSQYALAIHCGGCMLDRQAMTGRLSDIGETGIPITNYGLLLSYFESKESLRRVVEPWGHKLKF